MIFNKKQAGIVMLCILLLFLLSSEVLAATSVTEVEYVLYERSDGKNIIVDYQKALELYNPPFNQEPLKTALQEIEVALANFRQVYVKTDAKTIDYSKAVDDGKTYSEAIASTAYDVDIDLFALADLELYSQTGLSSAYRTPLLPEFPDGISYNMAWSIFARCWFVNIIIEEPYNPNNVDAVKVMGKTGVRGTGDNSNVWRVRIYESDLPAGASEPVINTTTVRVMYEGSLLW